MPIYPVKLNLINTDFYDITGKIHRYPKGVEKMLRGLLLLFFLFFILAGCTDPDPGDSGKIGIFGRIYHEEFHDDTSIFVFRNVYYISENAIGGSLVPDADVSINDITIPFDVDWGYTDNGTLITYIPGDTYTVKVVADGKTFEQTIIMPPLPAITSHADGAVWNESVPTNLAWNLADISHDNNEVYIYFPDTQSFTDYKVALEQNATDHTIPPGILKDGKSYPFGLGIIVSARTKFTDFSSDYHSESFLLFAGRDTVYVDTSK